MLVVLCMAASMAARPAFAVIPGVDNDRPFDAPNSPWYGMNWDYVYQTGAGTSVAVGYFTLLTAMHYPIDNGALFGINGDEFEVVRQELPPTDVGTVLPPDLRILRLRNNTDPMRPLPGFYELFTGHLDTDLDGNMVIVGTGFSGQVPTRFFYREDREDPSTRRAKRWGTNGLTRLATKEDPAGRFSTRCFSMAFERGTTPHESGFGDGDSGGGVFAKDPNGEWQLAGVNLYREGDQGWYSDVWAASVPAYARWLNGVLEDDVLPGDPDLDGDVDFRDYLTWKANVGMLVGARWENGDFNHDGRVDREDLRILVMNFGYTSPGHPVMTAGVFPVVGDGTPGDVLPEPAVIGLLAAGALVLLRRRPTRRR
ncbi:MAG: hypothetical protein WBF17_18320 [Phycisphaerae bacterium]